MTLPKLPEPAVKAGEYAGPPGEGASEDYWDREQVEAIRKETVEACAQVVENMAWSNWFQSDCAAAIRALLNTDAVHFVSPVPMEASTTQGGV